MARHTQHRVHSAQAHFIRPSAAALAVAACFSGPVLANPVNPTVVHGTASFATAGNILNITNSHNAIINWGSFSIGVNELTRFIQPSALSAVLNRVIGQDPSAILGALQSNGRVFLLNPNGIVFGAGAQINVAGLVASTLNLSNDDFLNNRMRFTDGAGAGSVVNHGQITGGSVYLVGNAVTNNGLITSPGGEVVLAAGNSVELVNPGTPNLRVEVVAPDNEARNLGTISAEAGRIGIYAGLINNSGTLNASSAVAEGGRIWLKAKKDITLASTSVIDASGQGGGEIIAFADNNMHVDGVLNASAPVSGNGGFIETSGRNRVTIADSAVITTAAAQGQTGTWLVDPNDFVIAAYGGDTTGSAIAGNLASTNVIITSTSGSGMYGGGNGDILVDDAISWSSGNSLTLTAIRNVDVNSPITNTGSGGLNLYAGWNGVGDGSTPALVAGVGNINVNSPISVGNTINMAAGGAVTIGAAVTANPACCSSGSNSVINISGSTVTVNSPVYARGSDGSEGQAGGNATITLSSSSSMQINSGGTITADGGEGGYGYSYSGDAGPGGNATVNLTSGGGLTIAANVQANGGYGGYGSSANGGRGGDGVVNAMVAGTLTVTGSGNVVGQGGAGGYAAYGGNTAGRGGDGKVMLSAVGGITIASGGQVRGTGGNGGDAGGSYYYGGNGFGGNGGDGVAQLMSTGGSITVSGSVRAQGGAGGSGGSYSGGGDGNGGHASVSLVSAGGIMINNGTVGAEGGDGGSSSYSSVSTGGTATVLLDSAGPITMTNANVYANGGDGGENGMGGNALVLVSSSSGIMLTGGGGASATGGESYDGTGGAAAVTMLAGGSIQIEGAEGEAWGGYGALGGNAAVTLVAGGDITIANQSAALLAETNSGGLGSVIVAAAGNVSLSNAGIYSDGTAGLGGANIMLNSADVQGSSAVSAGATGSLSLVNSSSIGSSGNAYITTGGNVNVDNSIIYGNPEVVMNVGGLVNMNNMGTIEAGSPQTILLTFPMQGGGFSVNGMPGVVYDSGTGFVVNGQPAQLGVNFFVTFSGGGNTVNPPTDALIVALGEATKPPDSEKDKDVFDELKKDKEKEAPVCR